MEIMLSSGKIITLNKYNKDFLSVALKILDKYDLTFTELTEFITKLKEE